MNNNSSILKSVCGYSISSWANLCLGFLYVIITTRLLLPDTYGRISLFYSVANVLMYILTIGMDGAMIRYYNEPPNGETTSQLLYKNITFSLIICLIAFLLGITILYDTISVPIFGISSRVLAGMLFIYITCQILLRYLNISFRMSFKTKQYNIQNILSSSMLKFLIVIAALISNDFVFIISFLTLGFVSLLTIYLYIQKHEYRPINKFGVSDYIIRIKGYGPYFRYALFSAPTYVTSYLNLYLGQQIVITKLSPHALGIFTSVGIFSQILISLRGGFSTYWSAYVYKNYQSQKDKIVKMHDYVVAMAIMGASCLVFFRDIIYMFIGTGFHESKSFFSVLLIMPFLAAIQETTAIGIYLKRRNEFALMNNVCSIIINVAISLLLINYIGLLGAAIANALSGIYIYIANTMIGQRYYKSIRNNWKSIIGTIIIVTILAIPAIFDSFRNALIVIVFINIIAFVLYKSEYTKIGISLVKLFRTL